MSHHAKAASFSVALFCFCASAAPAIREAVITAPTITDFTTSSIASFLATQNAENSPFNFKGPWVAITFAGKDAPQSSQEDINNAIYTACDEQTDRRNKTTINFSLTYKDFIQDVSKSSCFKLSESRLNGFLKMNRKVPVMPPSAAQNASSARMRDACYGPGFQNALQGAVNAWNLRSRVPANDPTDPKFISWAQENYPDYDMAVQNCTEMSLGYYKAKDNATGDDATIYSGAYAHILPLADSNELVTGINMQISGEVVSNDTDPNSGPGNNIGYGEFMAYYRIPTLNSTLSKWQSGAGLAPFKHSITSQSYTSVETSKFGGASLGITYEGFGVHATASHSSFKSSAEAKATAFEISFSGLALVGIEQGSWFDGYRVARAAEYPDSQHGPVNDVFKEPKYFGSKDQPGPLAVYNYQALIGFKPSWTIQMEDAISTNGQESTEASGGISFLGLLDIGGYAGSNTTKTSIDNSTNTFTVTDDTDNAYIIGFVQEEYWKS
ncbi:hypothetical protein B0H19DRAFT_1077115 [Mycena capillaripes]|nr:hypothetical protein B0H19DRAFT_1077115 [Mycena capillaripes]